MFRNSPYRHMIPAPRPRNFLNGLSCRGRMICMTKHQTVIRAFSFSLQFFITHRTSDWRNMRYRKRTPYASTGCAKELLGYKRARPPNYCSMRSASYEMLTQWLLVAMTATPVKRDRFSELFYRRKRLFYFSDETTLPNAHFTFFRRFCN